MAFPIAAAKFCSSSSSVGTSRPIIYACYSPPPPQPAAAISSCLYFPIKSSKIFLPSSFSQLGRSRFGPWSGFRQLGISISARSARTRWRGRCRGKVVRASLFGVGAPEALVIGVVALLVFGPKGLAEVARNLGKTLRAFQPTIKELQEVSREFKSSLEREIGLDDVPSSSQYGSTRANSSSSASVSSTDGSRTVTDPSASSSPSRAYSSEEYLKITEEQLKASIALQQSAPKDDAIAPKSTPQPQASIEESTVQAPATQKLER
ncbi:hypothetical protein Dimus_028230 [Dionaea muscipula]